jgi:hypothetical protein
MLEDFLFMFGVYGEFLYILLGSRKKSSSDNIKWRLRKLWNQLLLDLKISGRRRRMRLKIKGRGESRKI